MPIILSNNILLKLRINFCAYEASKHKQIPNPQEEEEGDRDMLFRHLLQATE
jgi:hypothetical protein